MKRTMIVLIVWASSLQLFASLSDGLVAWYKFDGNANDSSGNGLSLSSEIETTYVTDRNGIVNGAVQMNDNVLYHVQPRPGLTNHWTISCWFKADVTTALNDERTSGISGTSSNVKYLYCCQLAVGQNGVNCYEHADYWRPATLRYDADLGSQWHHLSLEASGADEGLCLYIDGQFVRKGLSSGRDKILSVVGAYDAAKGRYYGIGQDSYGGKFRGAIDDFRIYDRALSAAEVKALYDGYSWDYVVKDGEASVIGVASSDPIVPISGAVIIPSVLGGCPVTSVQSGAISMRDAITAVTIPASVTTIGESAFLGCRSLADVYFEGDALASVGVDAFKGCCWDLIMHVPAGWQGRGRTLCGYSVWKAGSSDEEKSVSVTATNVVVQYVLNSVRPEIAVPVSGDTGFVAVITEVKSSGAVSVPIEWKANYPQFETKFGTDFGKALMMKSGKKDCAGNDMFVWQDYVAGTDPTDLTKTFTASITMVGGVPKISHSPELSAEQEALRTYKIWGKVKLQDEPWLEVKSGDEANYNFFKVTVEMK